MAYWRCKARMTITRKKFWLTLFSGLEIARAQEPELTGVVESRADIHIVGDRNSMAERSGTQQPVPRVWD